MVWLLVFFVSGVGIVVLETVGPSGVFTAPDWLDWYNVSSGGLLVAVTTILLVRRLSVVWAFKRAFGVSPKLDSRIVGKAVHVAVETAIREVGEAIANSRDRHDAFEGYAATLSGSFRRKPGYIDSSLRSTQEAWREAKAARRVRRRAERRLRKLVVLAGRCHVLVEVPSEAASLGVVDIFRQVA